MGIRHHLYRHLHNNRSLRLFLMAIFVHPTAAFCSLFPTALDMVTTHTDINTRNLLHTALAMMSTSDHVHVGSMILRFHVTRGLWWQTTSYLSPLLPTPCLLTIARTSHLFIIFHPALIPPLAVTPSTHSLFPAMYKVINVTNFTCTSLLLLPYSCHDEQCEVNLIQPSNELSTHLAPQLMYTY